MGFPVTADDPFTVQVPMRTNLASASSGYVALVFLDARGVDGRDAVWSHPDLVPTSADLDDPLGFVAGETHSEGEQNADFDTALEELLKGESNEGDENPSS